MARSALCEQHISAIAALEARMYGISQDLATISTDLRSLTTLVQTHTTDLAVDRARTRVLVGLISAAVGLVGALSPSIVQAFLR